MNKKCKQTRITLFFQLKQSQFKKLKTYTSSKNVNIFRKQKGYANATFSEHIRYHGFELPDERMNISFSVHSSLKQWKKILHENLFT